MVPKAQNGRAYMRSYRISHLGAVHGSMDYLGVHADTSWVFGATGYAFMINVPRVAVVAGPTGWNWSEIANRTPNVGVDTSDFIRTSEVDADYEEKRSQARRFIENNLDAGIPVYGWSCAPEFFIYSGYSAEGVSYVFGHDEQSCKKRKGFVKWEDHRGDGNPRAVFVGSVKRAGAPAGDAKTIADALAFAVKVREGDPSAFGSETVGLGAYDSWIRSLQDGSMFDGKGWGWPGGMGHCAACWHECRVQAAAFLRQCTEKMGPSLATAFGDAADKYRLVSEALGRVKATTEQEGKNPRPTAEAFERFIRDLHSAKEAEEQGLALLETVLKKL